jgi:hypothetical protein
MRRLLLLIALPFLLPSVTFAKTHEQPFDTPCANVWAAVRQVLLYSGKYGLLFASNEDMAASYNIGGALGGKRTNSVHLKANGQGCTMIVQTSFSGLAHNDVGDFVKRVTEAISENPSSKSPAPSAPEATPQSPTPPAPEQAAPSPDTPKPSEPEKAAPAPATSAKALSKSDIIDLLKGEVTSARVVALVKERNINFTPTDDDYKEIRAAGGGDDLINVLKAEAILKQ